jgi:hypothetical protein
MEVVANHEESVFLRCRFSKESLLRQQKTLFGGKNYVREKISNVLALSGGST